MPLYNVLMRFHLETPYSPSYPHSKERGVKIAKAEEKISEHE